MRGETTWQTQAMDPILVQCWLTVCDAGPTLFQNRVHGLCFLHVDIAGEQREGRATSLSPRDVHFGKNWKHSQSKNKTPHSIGLMFSQRRRRWANIVQLSVHLWCGLSVSKEGGGVEIAQTSKSVFS